MSSNKKIPDFQFDEEKIKFLLDNTDQLISLLTKEQINLLVDSLKENHDKIEETIEKLKKSKDPDNNN
jgi:tetrahydromethanopterin S-methyltransferase subunit B